MLCYAYEQKSPMTSADQNPQSMDRRIHNMDDSPPMPMSSLTPSTDYGSHVHTTGIPHHPHYQVSSFGISVPSGVAPIMPTEIRDGDSYEYGVVSTNQNVDPVSESDIIRTSATNVWDHNASYAYTGVHNSFPRDAPRLFTNDREWNLRSEHMSYEPAKHFYPHPPSTRPSLYPSSHLPPITNGHHATAPNEIGNKEMFSNGPIVNGENVAKYGIDPANPALQRHPYDWINKNSYIASQPPATGKTRTKDKYRVVYSDHQRLELEKEFRFSRYITIRRKAELAIQLNLSERQIKIWFQNRRAKERKISKKRVGEVSSDTYPDSVKQQSSNSDDDEKMGMQSDLNNNVKCESKESPYNCIPGFEFSNSGESHSPTDFSDTNAHRDGIHRMGQLVDFRQPDHHDQFRYDNPPISHHQQLCGVIPMPVAVPVTPTDSNSDNTEKFTYESHDEKSASVCTLP
ncbi:uncharacterized protein LOC120341225 [Styela clava]